MKTITGQDNAVAVQAQYVSIGNVHGNKLCLFATY